MINILIFWCHSREGGNLCLIKFIEMRNEYFVYILANKKIELFTSVLQMILSEELGNTNQVRLMDLQKSIV